MDLAQLVIAIGSVSCVSLVIILVLVRKVAGLNKDLMKISSQGDEEARAVIGKLTTTGDRLIESATLAQESVDAVCERATSVSEGLEEALVQFRKSTELLVHQSESLRSEAASVAINYGALLTTVNEGFAEIRGRAIDDQLTRYPRMIKVDIDEKAALDHVEVLDGFLRIPGRWTRRTLHFRLVCESDKCLNKNGLYHSDPPYEIDSSSGTIDSFYLPKSGNVKKFVDAIHVFEGPEHSFTHVLRSIDAARPMFAVKLGITLGAHAHPHFAISLILVAESTERLIDRLQRDRENRDANRELWDLLSVQPLRVKDVGRPGHVQFGELIRRKEEAEGRHVYKSFGGLSRWIDPATHRFGWVCPTDAYDRISRLQKA